MRGRQDADRGTEDPQEPATTSPSQDFSIDYELLAEDGILIVRLAGRVSLERLKMVGPLVRAHPGFDHRIGLIHDLSRAEPDGFCGDDLSGLVAVMHQRSAPRGLRVAYVLPSDLAYELGCRFRDLAEGVHDRRRHLARSLDEALAWMRATPH